MGRKHEPTLFDQARDELFSHVVRCDVLEAEKGDRMAWLEETMDFMRHRYPDLTDLQLAQLEVIGRRFIKPAIPHGKQATAVNRQEWVG